MNRRLASLLTVFSLVFAASCEELPLDLPFGDMKSPQYWGDYFLGKFAAERHEATNTIEPGPTPLAEPRTVLLVTGVTIPAEWFDSIFVRLERDGFRPVVYEPPALLSGDLFQASRDLAEVVEAVRAESGQDTIDILAECTGGVIARHYVQSLGGDAYVDKLVTFVSPQNGIAKAPLAAAFAHWPALYDLSPGSEFLQAVQSVPLPASVAMTSIYTCTDEYIKPYQTSIVEGAHNIGLCDGFVGHFQTMYDPAIYLIMHDALAEGLALADPNAGDPGSDDPGDSDPGAMSPSEEESSDTHPDDQAQSPAGCSTGGSTSGSGGLLFLGLALLGAARPRPRKRSN